MKERGSQTTARVLMVSPNHFGSNAQAMVDNVFMTRGVALDKAAVSSSHAAWVSLLRRHGVQVSLVADAADAPDAVFCNNWFLLHFGVLALFPMKPPNRRVERRADIVALFGAPRLVDLTAWEEHGEFLEGTGSLVVDWTSGVAYVGLSQRSSLKVAQDFVKRFAEASGHELQLVAFESLHNGAPIYHTNVIMTVGAQFIIVCLEVVTGCRAELEASLARSGKRIVTISRAQMDAFCGNVLQVANVVCMSDRSFAAFSAEQLEAIRGPDNEVEVLHSDLSLLETIGGGGVRCCIAELF
jgi:hypothetical protein